MIKTIKYYNNLLFLPEELKSLKRENAKFAHAQRILILYAELTKRPTITNASPNASKYFEHVHVNI